MMNSSGMYGNLDKCFTTTFGKTGNDSFHNINRKFLEHVNSIKDLDVSFDCNLSINHYINYIFDCALK